MRIILFFVISLFLSTSLNYSKVTSDKIAKSYDQSYPQYIFNKPGQPCFIENRGQWDSEVLYLARINGMNTWITKSGVVYDYYMIIKNTSNYQMNPGHLINKEDSDIVNIKGHVVKMKYGSERSNLDVSTSGINMQTASHNYFLGSNAAKWVSGVPLYSEVLVKNVYEGIDVRYYFENTTGTKAAGIRHTEPMQNLRYDYIVLPGADPSQIKMSFDLGKNDNYGIKINDDDEMIIQTSVGEVKNTKLFAYQDETLPATPGHQISVLCSFIQNTDGSISFSPGDYDRTKPLIIDPLVYSTFLAGSYLDIAYSIAIDGDGNSYITGYTVSSNFPTKSGSYDVSFNGGYSDVFVTKFNSTASNLLYSTFIGGSGNDNGQKIVLDNNGNAFICGYTTSANFPTSATAYDISLSGDQDVFVTKLNANGSALLYSTYIGGNNTDYGYGLSIDADGNAFISGGTYSINYPTTAGSFDPVFNSGGVDAYVTKLNSTGTALVYSTFIGGTAQDISNSITTDINGNAYITGWSISTDFPVTNGVYDVSNNGNYDAFATKLNPAGSALIYSTYIGGSTADWGFSIVTDESGNAYIGGVTESSNYPVTSGAFDVSFNGNDDGFVTKIDPTGSNLIYSTFIGGSDADWIETIRIDNYCNAIITGQTKSLNFPVTSGAYDVVLNGYNDVFVAKINNTGSGIMYATYIGGWDNEYCYGSVSDGNGNTYVTGFTNSTNYPTTPGVYDEYFYSNGDAFVTKLFFIYPPQLISPENNSLNQTFNPLLVWQPVLGATSYTVQVSTASNFSTTLINQSEITNSNFQLNGLNTNTKYYWRIKSVSSTETSQWSSTWNFTTSLIYTISGFVKYFNSEAPLNNCIVGVYSGETLIDSSYTTSSGYYLFHVPSGAYTIKTYCDKPWNGLNIQDVIQTRLSIAKFRSLLPIQMIAADVNADQEVNTQDIVIMRQKIAFFNPLQWLIQDYVFESPTVIVNGANLEVNIYGLCGGDVNGSYTPAE